MKTLKTLFFFFLIASCNESKYNTTYKPSSSGNINNLLVVVDDELWDGLVGDALRRNIGSEIYGLPQAEPYFELRQVSTDVFSGFVRRNRIVLKIQTSEISEVKYYKDPFATPQIVAVISAPDKSKIIELIRDKSEEVISTFRSVEFKEKQRRISKSLYNSEGIRSLLGVDIKFSSAYRIAKQNDHFSWIRRDTENGSLNLLLYSLPIKNFNDNSSFQEFIIKSRDSVSKMQIPGPKQGDYMTTERSYKPLSFMIEVSGVPVFQTKSLWKVDGAFMSGPFVNYCFIDTNNNRLLIAEGFVYAPAKTKRDYMFELETIMRSITLD
tara:strand:+ start:818 stop:1789 length:972 start_codon:yes stop_codon:yes gene_type:complete